MFKTITTYLQYCLPQHLLTRLIGWLADSRIPWLKNKLIQGFIARYRVDLSTAQHTSLEDYPNFNAFFTRQLKPELRPIAAGDNHFVSPVDGTLAQTGSIKNGQLLQAKNLYFSLQSLLANDPITALFEHGTYATFYLAPRDYHRVHMPIDAHIKQYIYVPGHLFSVNKMTSTVIPNLYSRNERLIILMDTTMGEMIIIFVGAMIVGSIQTVWMQAPIKSRHIISKDFSQPLFLPKGAELGLFKMGSTIITLHNNQTSLHWQQHLKVGAAVQYGEVLADISLLSST